MNLNEIEKLFSDIQLGRLFRDACKNRDQDRIVSMVRVLGAMKNWCAEEDCGGCPLRIDGCTVDVERRVREFLDKCANL